MAQFASRRDVLKAGAASLVGASAGSETGLAGESVESKAGVRSDRSVILLWLAGGMSHVDTWDVKPDAPREVRGPFSPIETSVPGVFVSEHLPLQAQMMDKFTIIRSIDSTASNHQPNQVLQTGNLRAAPRTNPSGGMYPAIASVIARHRGANRRGMPPYVAFHIDRTHVAWGGYLGQQYDPVQGSVGPGLFTLPKELTTSRVTNRRELLGNLDRFPAGLDLTGGMSGMEDFGAQATEMVLESRARSAFDINQEPTEVRDRYNRVPFVDQMGTRGNQSEQVLLARRLVEAGVSFVTVVLSTHRNSGTWDTHGDPVATGYGGVEKGLKPLLTPLDHLLTTLVQDLEDRGRLDNTLVIAMGEFGRSPKINGRAGRDHWQPVSSLALAGGGFRHGQVIGGTGRLAGEIKARPVTPGDLAATIYRFMGVPLDATYLDPRGRPTHIVEQGEPISELV